MDLMLFIIITVILSALFSGMEIAFFTANKLRIELDRKRGQLSAIITEIFYRNKGQYISTLLIGNNIALVIFGILMSQLLDPIIRMHIHRDSLILLIQTSISTAVILVAGEFLPKSLFRLMPNRALHFFSVPIFLFYILFYPISRFIIMLSKFIIHKLIRLKKRESKEKVSFENSDLSDLLTESNIKHSNKRGTEEDMLVFKNALDFSKLKVRDCMIPRTEIIAVPEDCSISEITTKFIESGFSKILVYEKTDDNMIGYISSKDLFKRPQSIQSKIIRLLIVPETMPAIKLLRMLLQERKSIALVVDEFGGTSGMISIEDIMEEIVGDIEDEHDTDEMVEKEVKENEYILSARLEIEHLNKEYNLAIDESEEYATLGGYITNHLGRIPAKGEIIRIENFEIKIIKAKNTRIELLYLKLKND